MRVESTERSRLVAVWLLAVALVVLAMVVVGGATRLTGSGLSITEWRPISGALPPLDAAAWRHAFVEYQATPQYRLVNRGMTLGEFKFIFWWEWAHRLLGRVVGLVFFLPFLVLLITRRLPTRLVWRCALLFVLGGTQGLVGWWMVRSGLETRTSVAPERLAAHLGLALFLLAALVWTAWEAWFGPAKTRAGARGWSPATLLLAGAVYMQCLLGALVAGNRAGLIDNDWPRMGGHWFPTDYARADVWSTLAHSAAATQFNHRLLAYMIAVLTVGLGVAAARSRRAGDAVRGLTAATLVLLAVQIALGIATLMGGVPLPLAILHQLTAATLLLLTVSLAWSARRGVPSGTMIPVQKTYVIQEVVL